ncbi:MAG: tetratricopeptide repeat protein [Bacteroidales bacterium]|nr:tetratricopeptide repeat protein [Bacteroidales bacterium]
MNLAELQTYIENPLLIDSAVVRELESLINDFPYFQLAHILYIKGLNNINSIRYNSQLKTTACYTGDRTKLCALIKLKTIQKENQTILENAERNTFDFIQENENVDFIYKTTDEKSESDKNKKEQKSDNLLSFDYSDSLNFSEKKETKTQTIPLAPTDYLQAVGMKESEINLKNDLKKDMDLINEFLKKNPKIKPSVETNEIKIDNYSDKNEPESEFLTETLAEIYIKQQNYTKAIKIYQKLILKYPQKSIYFADRINEVKDLINNL